MGDEINILHVDDNPDFIDLTAEFLTRDTDQFSIASAISGSEGLEQVTSDVDCIISDYDMPGMNGLEFLEAVRETHPDLPFILFTGKGSEEVASEALTLGATDYLQKATGTDQYDLLANRVRRAVGQFRAEQELERKNDLLEKTQTLTDVGAWEFDPRTGEAYFTDKVYEIYGVGSEYDPDPEEDIQRFYHPEDRETVRNAVTRALEAGEPYDIEVRITSATGGEKWVRTQGDPLFVDGQCERVRGTIRDITDRKERERDLAQTKKWYQTLLDAAPDAVFVAAADSGEIREANQAAARLLGRPREELIGLHMTDLHPPGEAEAYAELFENHVAAGEGRAGTLGEQVDIYVVDAAGDMIPVEVNAQTVEIDGQQYNQGYFRDITDRKQRERELKRQKDRLDEIVTVVSHDFRNLVRTLSASIDMLETADTDTLEQCDRTVTRMEALVDDLVELVEHGEMEFDPEPVSLPQLVQTSAETLDIPADALAVETDATIVADQSRVNHLFESLLENAVTHGGPDVSVTVGRFNDGFYVADNGMGIPESEHDRVFRIGYSTSTEGTGFGLNIAKQVAEAHGWDIRLTNSAAGGARIELTGVEFTEG
jgi:PAS domain S-box-containing protein